MVSQAQKRGRSANLVVPVRCQVAKPGDESSVPLKWRRTQTGLVRQ